MTNDIYFKIDKVEQAIAIACGCVLKIIEIGRATNTPDEKIFENIKYQCEKLMQGHEDSVDEFFNKVPPRFI